MACPRCRYAAVNRPTCLIGYCVDCGWTFRNINGARKRCEKCADLLVFNTNGIPSIMRRVIAFEYNEHWRTRDDREFSERLYQKLMAEKRVDRAPVEHPCVVPTCGKERLYASAMCENHDEELNGPLGILIVRGDRKRSVGRCMRCRILTGSPHAHTPVFTCPFHATPQLLGWLGRYFHWNESLEHWTMACPVCFVRTSDPKQSEAWGRYVEHHLHKHREVALAVF